MHSNHRDGLSSRTRIFNYHSLPLSSSQKWPCCAIVLLRSKARGYPCPLDAKIFIQGRVLQKWTKQRQFSCSLQRPGRKEKDAWLKGEGEGYSLSSLQTAAPGGRFIPTPASPWGSWVLLCLARAGVTLTLTALGLLTTGCKDRMCPMIAFALGLLAGVSSLWHVVSQAEPGNWVLWSPTRYSSLAAQVFN